MGLLGPFSLTYVCAGQRMALKISGRLSRSAGALLSYVTCAGQRIDPLIFCNVCRPEDGPADLLETPWVC